MTAIDKKLKIEKNLSESRKKTGIHRNISELKKNYEF